MDNQKPSDTSQLALLEKRIADLEAREMQLQKGYEYLEQLYERAPLSYQSLDADGCIIIVNQAWLDTTGYTKEEVIGKHFSEFLHPKWRTHFKEHFPRFKAVGEILGVEFEMQKKDGTTIVVSFTGNIGKDLAGHFQQTHCIFSDITERERSAEALRQSESRMQAITDSVRDAIIMMDPNGSVTYWNPAAERIFGYAKEEALGSTLHRLVAPARFHAAYHAAFARFQRTGQGKGIDHILELEALHQDGHEFSIELSLAPLLFQDGWYATGVVRDITERKQTEKMLRASEKKFRAMVETIPLPIYLSEGTEQVATYINPMFTTLFGYTLEDVPTAEHWWPLAYPDEQYRNAIAAEWNQKVQQAIATQQPIAPMETVVTCKDGTKKYISWNFITLGCMNYSLATDLTERKQADKERSWLLHLLDSSLNEMYVFDAVSLRLEYVSPAACRNLGYTIKTLQEMTHLDLQPELTRDIFSQTITSRRQQKPGEQYVFETIHRRADGSLYPVEVHLQLIDTEDKQVFLAIVNDITESVRGRSERRQLLAAIEQSDDVIVITDVTGNIEYVNPAFEKVTGYSVQDAYQQNPRILKSGMHDDAFYTELWSTISSGRTWAGRLVNKHKDGSLYTEDATISPVVNGRGKIVNYVAVKRDVTAQIQLQAQLYHAQKMESVGRLAGGVAHDFNNMLSVILGYAELALSKVDPSESLHEDLLEIFDAARRSADITRQLLAFARKQTIAPLILDLNETVESMLKMLRRLIGEDIDFTWSPGANLQQIKMDLSQLDQLLANLCVNARDAIEGVGKITLTTGMATITRGYCDRHAGFTPGTFVFLAVSDDGIGMDDVTVGKIFEPFFTTKETGKGTGLGLATVYGIVKQNNGYIDVCSEPGKGSTFTIYLPCHEGGNSEKEKTATETIQSGRGETILVVEDEEVVLKLCHAMLATLGYSVLTARTPDEGLRLAKTHAGTIHLLITDVIMPDMNGRELAMQLSRILPDVKTLFMSGYAADVISRQGMLAEGLHFLRKPFSVNDLGTKVREVLDQQ